MTIMNASESRARTRRGRRAGLPVLLAALVALPGCGDLLEVENPNNLVEENIRLASAATAVVNGSLALVSDATSAIWQPYLQVSDELTWIGSRDAWLQLDHGFISDPFNEFTDAAFPELGEARWMADEAVEILEEHVSTTPTKDMKKQLARAYFYSGLVYMIIGEVQQDFAFSDKTEPAPPVGPANMSSVLDDAVAKLDKAAGLAAEVGETDLETAIIAARARAKHSRAIWSKIKPSPQTASPLVSGSGAEVDARTVIQRVGPTTDWTYKFKFSPASSDNDMASWVNSRAENQFDFSLVEVDPKAPKKILGVKLQDPIDNVPDPVITAKLTEWKSGDIGSAGNVYPPLTVVSNRLMHLIAAEHHLGAGEMAQFTSHINRVRAMDELTPYTGQIPAMDMLKHSRRVNLFLMGLRLNDMYRFGITDPKWQPNSDAIQAPGTLLPITIIERRANPHLSGSG